MPDKTREFRSGEALYQADIKISKSYQDQALLA